MVSSSSIKAVIISTGITVMALLLKAYLPLALDLSLSQSPILWSSFLSWLKPPYLFVVINVIITIIVASSSYHDGEDEEILHGDDDDYQIIHETEQIVVKDVDLDPDFDFPATFPPPVVVAEAERSEVVYEEKEKEKEEKEISGVINGGDETSKLDQMMEESENLAPTEKLLVTASSDHRKPVKASQKGGSNKRKKVLRVAKPKRRNETATTENTWKMVTEEGKSTPLTVYHRRSDTVGVDAGEVQQRPLRKSVTFRDMTNCQRSPSPVKMKKEMSPSREELNRRVEAFIRKCKEERLLESMRLDTVVV